MVIWAHPFEKTNMLVNKWISFSPGFRGWKFQKWYLKTNQAIGSNFTDPPNCRRAFCSCTLMWTRKSLSRISIFPWDEKKHRVAESGISSTYTVTLGTSLVSPFSTRVAGNYEFHPFFFTIGVLSSSSKGTIIFFNGGWLPGYMNGLIFWGKCR